MSDDEIKKLINFWMQHWLAVGLLERGANGDEFDTLMDQLGELYRSRAERLPEQSGEVVAFINEPNPWLIAQVGMAPALVNAPLSISGGMWEWLATRAKQAADAVRDAAEAAAAQAAQAAQASGTETVLQDAQWFLTLSLRRIRCETETEGFFLDPTAGLDDFELMGNWRYDGSGYKAIPVRRGKFDSGTSLPPKKDTVPESQAPEFTPPITMANVEIKRGNDFKLFEANVFGLEEDGMSAATASAFAHLLGGLATLGINALFKSIEVKTGVEIPKDAKDAFENYGIPGLIGVLAGAWGPEAFVPKVIRVRTKLKPNAPQDRPEWRCEIVHPTATMVRKIGTDVVKGDFTLREGELVETDIDGNDVPNFAEDLDQAEYQIYVQVSVKQT